MSVGSNVRQKEPLLWGGSFFCFCINVLLFSEVNMPSIYVIKYQDNRSMSPVLRLVVSSSSVTFTSLYQAVLADICSQNPLVLNALREQYGTSETLPNTRNAVHHLSESLRLIDCIHMFVSGPRTEGGSVTNDDYVLTITDHGAACSDNDHDAGTAPVVLRSLIRGDTIDAPTEISQGRRNMESPIIAQEEAGAAMPDMLAYLVTRQASLNDMTFAKHHIHSVDSGAEMKTESFFANLASGGNLGSNSDNCVWLRNYIWAARTELGELEELIPQKWWAKNQLDLAKAREEFIDVLHFMLSIGLSLGLDAEGILDVYKNKNAVNIARQEQGYAARGNG